MNKRMDGNDKKDHVTACKCTVTPVPPAVYSIKSFVIFIII